MTRDLGVWTAPDCALVLIDYQEEMLSSILSEPDGVEPLKDGSDVRYVTDAAGRRSQTAHRTGIERLAASAHGGH